MGRRRVLQAGLMGAASLSLPQMWGGQALAATENGLVGFGKAKRCIILFMWGGPSHIDTWDPKPHAPAEIRGEFQAIQTRVPGLIISEHFPRLAQQTDRLALIRSMTHDDPAHLSSVHQLLTGSFAPKRFSDADPPSGRDTPHIGSVVSRVRGDADAMPSFVSMPWIVSHPAAPGGKAPGQHGGWLGRRFDPFLVGDPNDPHFRIPGIHASADLSSKGPESSIAERQRLRQELDHSGGDWAPPAWQELTDRAVRLISDPRTQSAFDLSREPDAVRERYGRNTHGQCVLLARRLIEAGVPLVTVNWHNDGQSFWDTHGNNFVRLREQLMPATDLAFSALLDDLAVRGLLDETLVVWVGEFGRKPTINPAVAGREHWPRCYSAVLAGGGIHGGMIHGASDRQGAYPAHSPVSPSDLSATLYHALGLPADLTLTDHQGVPKHLVVGRPILPLFTGSS